MVVWCNNVTALWEYTMLTLGEVVTLSFFSGREKMCNMATDGIC